MTEDMLDRFHIPDEATIIRGESEGGSKSKWDKIFHPEELPENTEFSGKGNRIPGGGKGAFNTIIDNPECVDPELLMLYKEFRKAVKEIRKMSRDDLGQTFSDWLNDEYKREPDGFRAETLRAFDVYPDEVDFDVKQLKKMWGDAETQVNYVFSAEDKRKDTIEFVNKNNQGKNEIVNIPVPTFNNLLINNGIQWEVKRPIFSNQMNNFRTFMKSLVVDKQRLATEDFSTSYNINLDTNPQALDRKIENPRLLKTANRFFDAWKSTDDPVQRFGIGFNNGTLSHLALETRNGEVDVIPSWVFRTGVNGAMYREGDSNGKVKEGIGFQNSGAVIDSETANAQVAQIVRDIKIDGAKLPEDTEIFIVRRNPATGRYSREIFKN